MESSLLVEAYTNRWGEDSRSRLMAKLATAMTDKGYSDVEINATLCAFEIAEEIHIDEGRESTKRPYITHPHSVAQRLIEYGHDYTTIASALLHDTVEALLKTQEFDEKKQGLDHVVKTLNHRLEKIGLGEFQEHSGDIRQIVGVLTLDPEYDYFENIDKIFELEDELNVMRSILIKCADRTNNTVDTLGYKNYKKLVSVSKTVYVANKAKKHMVMRENFFERGYHRLKHAHEYLRESDITFTNLIIPTRSVQEMRKLFREGTKYWYVAKQQRTTRRFLFKSISRTLEDLVRETYPVLRRLLRVFEHGIAYSGDVDRSRIVEREIFEIDLQRIMYYDRGGFDRVTLARFGSILDGMLSRFKSVVRKESTLNRRTFSDTEIYAFGTAYTMVLRLLVRPDKPKWYIKGY